MQCEYCSNAIPAGSTKCPSCGAPVNAAALAAEAAVPAAQPAAPQVIFVNNNTPQNNVQIPPKSKTTAALLAFFLGALGIHNFYLGYTVRGVIQLILSLTFFGLFISGPWALIEFILILVGSLKDVHGRNLV